LAALAWRAAIRHEPTSISATDGTTYARTG